jgi:nucleoside-diphosphate-sugar epimerase
MASRPEAAGLLAELGAESVVVDATDGRSVDRAVAESRPQVVINQLTSLPKHYTPEAMKAAAARDREVRLEAGANLLAAARRAGARRFVASSGAYFSAPGDGLADEESPFALEATPGVAASARLMAEIENQLRRATDLETVALRYGFFYGPGTWYWPDGDMADQVRAQRFPIVGEGRGVWSFVHIEDAALATVLAVEASAPSPKYVLTDDEPSELRVLLPAFAGWIGAPDPPRVALTDSTDPDSAYYANRLRGASNARAKRELGFQPRPEPWFETHRSAA